MIGTYLQYNCIAARFATSTFLGDDASKSLSKAEAAQDSVVKDGQTGELAYDDQLLIATSAHRNFIENAPFALLFGALVELNGGSRRTLAGVLGLFTLARVSHIVGLKGAGKAVRFRQFGFFGSAIPVLGLASWGAYLTKGYWNL